MAGPTKALQVRVDVSATVRLRGDVVDAGGRLGHALPQVFLTQPFVTLEDPRADDLPLRAVAALVSCLTGFVLLPAFTLMCIAGA